MLPSGSTEIEIHMACVLLTIICYLLQKSQLQGLQTSTEGDLVYTILRFYVFFPQHMCSPNQSNYLADFPLSPVPFLLQLLIKFLLDMKC